MASNKFAAILYRNKTPKIAIVLIYTLLEWTLIAFLLLNGLFSYLIDRFAGFFGLTPPCVFCSRVDHVFGGRRRSLGDLVCDSHAAEVSKLGYCSSHEKLAEASEMCEDCSSSRPETTDRTVAVLSWMKRSEEGERDLRCSCCHVSLENEFYSPYLVVKPSSWGVLDYDQKGKLDEVRADGEKFETLGEEVEERDERGIFDENWNACVKEVVDDESLKLIAPMRADNGFLGVEERLVPIELIDSSTLIMSNMSLVIDEDNDDRDYDGYNPLEEEDTAVDVGTVSLSSEEEEEKVALLSTAETSVVDDVHEECSSPDHQCEALQLGSILEQELDVHVEEEQELDGYNPLEQEDTAVDVGTVSSSSSEEEEEEKVALLSTVGASEVDAVEEECSSPDHQCEAPQFGSILEEELDVHVEEEHAKGFGEYQASEEDSKVEANCEISIGSEICDHEQIELPRCDELAVPQSACTDEQCTASSSVIIDNEQFTEAALVGETITGNISELSVCADLNEVEEEKMPETPTSVDSFHALHKRFLYERREYGTESFDGSVASEIDPNEILTVDHFKAALKAESRALSALYAELEEERSASAIAANQTMAMITRLQEEKAAMQMEALQYQRMMEEQSEYDQEALQLLNDLVMKREQEKQELEQELVVYRKKVLIYEAKERGKAAKRSKTNSNGSGTSSASSSADDSDDLSFESREGKYCSYHHDENNQDTPIDDILCPGADQEVTEHLISLDESLADFEEERLSILEQLKALEEKFFSMDGDELNGGSVNGFEHSLNTGHQLYSDENAHGINGDYDSHGSNVNGGSVNGFEHDLNTNGKHPHEPKNVVSRGKRLLPLFDAAVGMESEDGMSTDHEARDDSPQYVLKSEIADQKRLAVAEGVNNVYERLQALEADREFLKHCVRSLKKGDKGMDLLQEILQHLHDLRKGELHVRNAGDTLSSLSALSI